MSEKAIEKIESISKKEGISESSQVEGPDKTQFDSIMGQEQGKMPSKATQEHDAAKPSLISEMERSNKKEKSSKVEEVSKKEDAEGQSIENPEQKLATGKEELTDKVSQEREASKGSAIEEVERTHQKSSKRKTTSEAVTAQTQDVSAQIEKLKDVLSRSEKTEIKDSYRSILRNKLTHIDDNVKITLSKAGLEYKEPTSSTSNVNPLLKLFDGLSNAQTQMNTLGAYMEGMSSRGQQMATSDILAIQVKMNTLQQELEFFSSVLTKALESAKTIMNVQV